jgi:hypothetical protein
MLDAPPPTPWQTNLIRDGKHFHLELIPPAGGSPTSEETRLATDVTRVARCLNSIFGEDSFLFSRIKPYGLTKVDQYLNLLVKIAQTGLGTNPGQTTYAEAMLAALEEEIFILGGYAKRRVYLIRCAIYSSSAAVVCLALFGLPLCSLFDFWDADTCKPLRGIFLILAGSMLGIWLSIASGRVATTLTELEQVINDPLGPGLRIMFVLNIAFAGAVLLFSGLIDLTIGDLKLKELTHMNADKAGQMLLVFIGVLFGFSEKTLPSLFASRAQAFIASLGAKAKP